MLKTLSTTVLPILGGYLLSKADPIATFFSPYLQTPWQLPVLLSLVLLLCVLIPYKYRRKNVAQSDLPSKDGINQNRKRTKKAPLELTKAQLMVLKVFRANDGELTSVPFIQTSTGLEPIIINSILDDLEKNKIIHATNLDNFNGGWQWQLTDKGVKTIIKYT